MIFIIAATLSVFHLVSYNHNFPIQVKSHRILMSKLKQDMLSVQLLIEFYYLKFGSHLTALS